MKLTEHVPLLSSVQDLSVLTAARSEKWKVILPAGVKATPLDVLLTVAWALYFHVGIPLKDELALIDIDVFAGAIVNDNGDEVLPL